MSELHEQIRFLNPRLLDDAPGEMVRLAARILRYERYLDHLELTKGKQGALPPGIETSAGRSIQETLADVKAACNIMLEWIDELELTGTLPLLIPYLARQLGSNIVSASSIISEQGSYLESWLAERGMPVELWRWALKYLDMNGFTATADELNLRVLKNDKIAGVIAATDVSSFDAASILGLPSREKPINVSAASAERGAVQTLVSFYEHRARMTTAEGVQVLPTGVAPVIIIILIVAFIAFVVGLVITTLCLDGTITDGNFCAFGVALLIAGLLGGIVGAITGGQQESENDPDPSPNDPPG